MIKSKRILVTGGAGFIGSTLVEKLLENGNTVTVVDNLSTGRIENLEGLDVNFHEISTTNFGELKKVYETSKPQIVFHLAANADVPKSIREPLHDFKTLQGSLNLLELTRTSLPDLFVYVSSGFIFGNTKNRPIKENEEFKPISPYSITKRSIEYYISFYHDVYGLQYVGLRPATVYGPKQIKGAMADYIDKLSNNSQAEIYGDGTKTRDYLYITDMIDALVSVSEMNNIDRNQIYNLGTKIETELRDLYEKIAKMIGKDPNPIFKADRPGELEFYSIDHDKFTKATGWKHKVSLDEGLKHIMKHRKLTN